MEAALYNSYSLHQQIMKKSNTPKYLLIGLGIFGAITIGILLFRANREMEKQGSKKDQL